MKTASDVYRGMRNRAIENSHYRPGFKFYEIDLLIRLLRDKDIRFCVADPNYGVCGKDPDLNGAPEILVVDPPPCAPKSKGLALWVLGNRMGRPMSTQEDGWLKYMREIGWDCSVNFMAEDSIPDLIRLGYMA